MKFKNKFTVKVFDRHGRLEDHFTFHNLVTQEAKKRILDSFFFASVPIAAQYIGGILSEETTNITAQDTLAIKDWNEATNYAARGLWSPIAGSLVVEADGATTFAEVDLTVTSGGTWAGFFVAGDSTVGETTSDLLSVALFPQGPLQLNTGDIVKIVYEVTVD